MVIKESNLREIFPNITNTAINQCLEHINYYLKYFGITNQEDIISFISNCGQESSAFSRFTEDLNYSEERLLVVFKSDFKNKTHLAKVYAHKPEKIANFVYANQNGNGDESSGDGWRFRGRGAIMTTGRVNYLNVSKALNEDFIKNPDLLATPKYAIASAAWFYKNHVMIKA